MSDFSIKCEPVADAPLPVQNEQPKEPTFALPPAEPVMEAVEGIRFDFNHGLRVRFPETGEYRCVFKDLDTDCLLYSMDVKPGCTVESVKKFFIRFGLEVYRKEDLREPVFKHDLDLAGKEVLIQLPVGALGDTIAWFSFVERFQQKHDCKLSCSMAPEIADLFRAQYPDIEFVTKDEAAKLSPYATYNLGLFFGGNTDHQPFDFRQVGLHRTAGHILGLDDITDILPRVDLSAERKIKEKYVVIAAQASSQCKYWNHPSGWREVVAYLKSQGYRVLCVDRMTEYGTDYTWNHIPYGAEDFTGDRPLQERIDLLKDADMFIGLSSGLSWLAWCCNVPVVLISGFTDPVNEFATPYRVQNATVCHGCWNDTRCDFNHFDFLWCPRKKEARDKFECTKAITPKMVIDQIRKIQEKNHAD
ncbi:MAG: Glycosyltransferase TibC [Lentisphaerae bacterium ADurb.Bin242]|nr:MAG: Glycosyltransferase TibC [Lentisphaerae bacterium ADurb.Bin242]